jgi:ABC-type proline/glycine betaine transport system permease subunit
VNERFESSPITQVTGILYTIPSLAFFFLLLPITGRGNTTAIIALTAYTLLILFRNTYTLSTSSASSTASLLFLQRSISSSYL